MSKPVKTGNETRETKVAETVINDNSELAKKAQEQAKADQEARAKAVGLKKNASIEDIIEAETKASSEAAKAEEDRQKALKKENHKAWVLENAINSMFAERAKTTMAPLTETEVRATLGKTGQTVNLHFNYSNDEKTKGYIEIEEFEKKYRCPLEGEFDFGIDYAAIAKAKQDEKK